MSDFDFTDFLVAIRKRTPLENLLVEQNVLDSFAIIWKKWSKQPLKKTKGSLRNMLRRTRVYGRDGDHDNGTVILTYETIAFHISKEGPRFRVLKVEPLKEAPRFHKDVPDMDVTKVIFPPEVVRLFTNAHRQHLGLICDNPEHAAREILANTTECFGLVLQDTNRLRRFRLSLPGKKERRHFWSGRWLFTVEEDANAFTVRSISLVWADE